MPEESLGAKAALLHSQPKETLGLKAQHRVCPLGPSHSPPLCPTAPPPVPQDYSGLRHQDKSQLWAAGSMRECVTWSHTLREDFGNLFCQVCSIKGRPAHLRCTPCACAYTSCSTSAGDVAHDTWSGRTGSRTVPSAHPPLPRVL